MDRYFCPSNAIPIWLDLNYEGRENASLNLIEKNRDRPAFPELIQAVRPSRQ
jgi:hypothetical protein